MKTSDFAYDLPDSLIAQTPLADRAGSRLLVLNRADGSVTHQQFNHITDYIQPGDALVVNETSVIPARLFGVRETTGAKVELLLLRPCGEDEWETLVKPGKRVREGEWLSFGEGKLRALVLRRTEQGGRVVRFSYAGDFDATLDELGEVPLPPYIHEKAPMERYQTVYARERGSVAAPTAGLHFTPQLLDELQQKGVHIVRVLLHVGLGTFRPVSAEDISEHNMHAEYYRLEKEAAQELNDVRRQGGRIIAVGTTSVRVLESAADEKGVLSASSGWTDIFITPGYTFKVVDALVTNFHLPESTLLMLVSALAGRENVLAAYQQAIDEQYRFFSFGDAMLIL